jgi:hypothetical protein
MASSLTILAHHPLLRRGEAKGSFPVLVPEPLQQDGQEFLYVVGPFKLTADSRFIQKGAAVLCQTIECGPQGTDDTGHLIACDCHRPKAMRNKNPRGHLSTPTRTIDCHPARSNAISPGLSCRQKG